MNEGFQSERWKETSIGSNDTPSHLSSVPLGIPGSVTFSGHVFVHSMRFRILRW